MTSKRAAVRFSGNGGLIDAVTPLRVGGAMVRLANAEILASPGALLSKVSSPRAAR